MVERLEGESAVAVATGIALSACMSRAIFKSPEVS